MSEDGKEFLDRIHGHWILCMQVAVDLNHHKTMLDLHNKVTTSEVLVGW